MGFKGCPPISVYTEANVRRGLNLAAINFCNNECEIDLEKKKVCMSKIFLWYKKDFIEAIENKNAESNNEDKSLLL